MSWLPGRPASGIRCQQIVAEAVAWARRTDLLTPDPSRLLGLEFTLSDLQQLHEAVAGRRLVKDTFRRSVVGALERTGKERTGTVGRPAALYRHRPGEL